MAKTKTVKCATESRASSQLPEAAMGTTTAEVKPDPAKTFSYTLGQGICLTCNHSSKCLFFRAARRPIMFCDEFDNQSNGAPLAAPSSEQLRDGHNYEQGPPPSICVNCDNRLACMHRTAGEPVLECEDYA